jgi:hypothetical protein
LQLIIEAGGNPENVGLILIEKNPVLMDLGIFE